MLYDPKWEVQTKANPKSPERFIGWLETMPPTKRYNFMNCNGACLVGQYMKAVGIEWDHSVYAAADGFHYAKIGNSNFGSIACEFPRTFGGALERARAALR